MDVETRLKQVNPVLLKETITLSSDHEAEKPNVVAHDDVRSTDIRLTGGKGSSLGILNCVRDVNVPYYFCVTTHAFRRMVEAINLHNAIDRIQELSDALAKAESRELELETEKNAESMKKSIIEFEFPEYLVNDVRLAYFRMCELIGMEKNTLSVAVRSSATTEDLEDASFAGIHQSFLNQRGIDSIIKSIKQCWASAFGITAIKYRMYKNIAHADAEVAVVIQKLVFPVSAGTSFNIEIGTGFPGLHVASSYGLGESLVSGEVTSDEWLLNNDLVVIKRICGSKRIRYQILENCSGIARVESNETIDPTKRTFSLSDELVKKTAETTKRIGEVYEQLFGYSYIDTEFAVSTTPTLYFLQARPVVPVIWDKLKAVDKKFVKQSDILAFGKFSLLGSSVGKIHVITDFQKLVSGEDAIDNEDIIVAPKTGNYWTQYLVKLRGIITVEGSPTAHPMLLGRERKIPCVIGIENAVEIFKPYHGQWVTLDGLNKAIYLGKKPLIDASVDELSKQFETVQIEQYQRDDVSKNFLLSCGRAEMDGDRMWVVNKAFVQSPLVRDITKKAYPRRANIINNARNEQIDLSQIFCDDLKVKNGKVYDVFVPMSDTADAFVGMGLDECQKLHASYHRTVEDFDRLSKVFSLDNWDEIASVYIDLVAHMWLSFFFRAYLNRIVSIHANKLGVSIFHLDRFQQDILLQIDEEDDHFRRAIIECAIAILKKYQHVVTLEQLQADSGAEYQQLCELAQNYRISKTMDIRETPPISQTFSKVVSCISEHDKNVATLQDALGVDKKADEEYFIHSDEFKSWVELGIRARVQHSDAHHVRARGQWRISQVLRELGDDVFECCVDEVNDMMKLVKSY